MPAQSAPDAKHADGASGFLVYRKPVGWSSFDVVAKLRSVTGQRSIGHAGTLDPFAEGVLVVGLGRALKVIEYIKDLDKTYLGRLRLGQTSDTDDVDGRKTSVEVRTAPTQAAVQLALERQTGRLQQVPPSYAALKVGGRRMYQLARKGLEVERVPRTVTVHELTLLRYEYPAIDVRVRVSSGTYVRAIARDVGRELKTGAFLEQLVRESVGPFTLAQSHTLDEVQQRPLTELLLPLEIATEHLPQVSLSEQHLARLANGQAVTAPAELTGQDVPTLAVVRNGRLLMLVAADAQAGTLKMIKLVDTTLTGS